MNTEMETSTPRVLMVYAVIPKADGRDVRLRVGSAYANRDGSLSVLLDAMPTNGRLQICAYAPRDKEARRRAEAMP